MLYDRTYNIKYHQMKRERSSNLIQRALSDNGSTSPLHGEGKSSILLGSTNNARIAQW